VTCDVIFYLVKFYNSELFVLELDSYMLGQFDRLVFIANLIIVISSTRNKDGYYH